MHIKNIPPGIFGGGVLKTHPVSWFVFIIGGFIFGRFVNRRVRKHRRDRDYIIVKTSACIPDKIFWRPRYRA
eukprot:SAG11_NODE_38856_length_247_cov_52.121622_1_plen_71_part_10